MMLAADAGLETVAPGVLRLPLRTPTLPPATTTNTLIVVGERVAVIEPATPDRAEQQRLDRVLDELDAAGHPLAAILLTHHHGDHIGYAPALQRARGAPIFAHGATAARLSFVVDEQLGDDDTLALGDGVTLRAVFTPGHAPGHLVFVEERSAVAYVGDMIAGEGTILIDPYDGGDMAQYLDSLRRVGALGVRALVPAHGPVLHDPAAAVEHYVRHRLAREARVLEAVAAGFELLDDVLAQVYADTPSHLWPLAERSLEAHLRKLVGEGRVVLDGARVRTTGR